MISLETSEQNKKNLIFIHTFKFEYLQSHNRRPSLCVVDTKAMRLPEIFGLSTFPVFRSPKQVRYKDPSFESPKILRNLPKIFPKILTENKSRKLYRNRYLIDLLLTFIETFFIFQFLLLALSLAGVTRGWWTSI